MTRPSLAVFALSALALAACPPADSDTSDASDAGADAGALQWYLGCGDPVCSTHRPNPAVAECTTQVEGQGCASAGATCDPVNDCNSLLICTDTDPTQQTGGCPRSLRSAKRDIAPLDDTQRAALAESVRTMPLSTWRYHSDAPSRAPRLGFVIDEVGASPAVDPERGIVDLYGFTTMAVAALQAQAEELAALRREVESLREELRKQESAAP
jgi:hypothetical protein